MGTWTALNELSRSTQTCLQQELSVLLFGFQGSCRSLISSLKERQLLTFVDLRDNEECWDQGWERFSACEHCSEVECLYCTDEDNDNQIWSCEKCGTSNCYHCRRKFGLGDNTVSSCSKRRPLKAGYDNYHLMCGSCRFTVCCSGENQ